MQVEDYATPQGLTSISMDDLVSVKTIFLQSASSLTSVSMLRLQSVAGRWDTDFEDQRGIYVDGMTNIHLDFPSLNSAESIAITGNLSRQVAINYDLRLPPLTFNSMNFAINGT